VRLFQLLTTPSNIFNSFPDSVKIPKSSIILTVDLYDEGGNRLTISDTREPVEIVISRPDTVRPLATDQHAVMSSQDDRVDLFYYQVNVTTNDSSLHIEFAELDPTIQLLVLARFDQFPQLNTTDQSTRGWDFMQLLPISRTNIGQSTDTWLLCLVTPSLLITDSVVQDRHTIFNIASSILKILYLVSSEHLIGAPKFSNGSHDLTTPLSGTVGCDLHIQPVHQICSLCDRQLRRCIRQCEM